MRNLKSFISILMVIAIILSFSSCAFTPTELAVGVSEKISTFDPVKAQSDSETLLMANCFEGLVRFNSDNSIHLANATGYSIDKTGKIYTFTLNPEAKYHISQQAEETLNALGLTDFNNSITADDYVYGFKRYFTYGNNKLTNIVGSKEFKSLNSKSSIGVKAIDNHTLEITLEKTDPDFLYKLASLPIFPCNKEFLDKLGDSYATTPGTVLSNGPFYVDSTDELETVIKSCSDYNGLKRTKNTTVTLYFTGDKDSYKKRFENGTYNVYLGDCTNEPKGSFSSIPYSTTVWGIGFNGESPIGKNANIRDILFKILDLSSFELPAFATGSAKRIVPDSFILKDTAYGKESAPLATKTDKETAQLMLKKLLSTNKVDSFTLTFAYPTELKSQADKILENWNIYLAPQLQITPIQYEMDKAEKFLNDGGFDIAIMPISADEPTALNILETLKEKPLCYKNNKAYASLYKRYNFDSDLVKAFENAEDAIVKENVFFPLFYSGKKLYINNETEGVFAANNGQLIYFHSAEKVRERSNEEG